MLFLRGLLDRILLIGAVVAGGLVPGFVAQYRQRLGGRLDQARLDLELWQSVADRFHQGDIQQLIRHHLGSSDPSFHSEGEAIQSLVIAVEELQRAVTALQGSLFQQLKYLAFNAKPDIARATFADWVPTFALSFEGLMFALAFALAVWVVFYAVWWLVAAAIEQLFVRQRHGTASAQRRRA